MNRRTLLKMLMAILPGSMVASLAARWGFPYMMNRTFPAPYSPEELMNTPLKHPANQPKYEWKPYNHIGDASWMETKGKDSK